MLGALRGAATSALQYTTFGRVDDDSNQGGDYGLLVENGLITRFPPLGRDASTEMRLERVRVLHGKLENCLKKLELNDGGNGEGEEGGNSEVGGGGSSSSKRLPTSTYLLDAIQCIRILAETVTCSEKAKEPSVFQLFCELGCLNLYTKATTGKWRGNIPLQRQVIQSMSLLMYNITDHTTLYLLLSNNHINNLIDQERSSVLMKDDELLAHYVSFLKAICVRLSSETVQFFLNERLNSFPLFRKALPLLTVSNDVMVRTNAMSMILHIYQVDDPGLRRFWSRPENLAALSSQIGILFRHEYSFLLSRMRYVEEGSNVRGVDCSGELKFAVDQLQDYVWFLKDLLHVNEHNNRQFAKELLVRSEILVEGVITSFLSPICSHSHVEGSFSSNAQAIEVEPNTKKEMYVSLFITATMLRLDEGSILSSQIIAKVLTDANIAVVSYLLHSYDEQDRLLALVLIRSVQQGIANSQHAMLPFNERNNAAIDDSDWINLYSGVLNAMNEHSFRQPSIMQLSYTILAAAGRIDWNNQKRDVVKALKSSAVGVLGWMEEHGCKKAIIELRAAVEDEVNLEVGVDDLINGATLLLPPVSGSAATTRSAFNLMKAFLLRLRLITEKYSVTEPSHTEVGELSTPMITTSLVREDKGQGQKCTNGSEGYDKEKEDGEETLEEAAAAIQKQKPVDHGSQDRLLQDNYNSGSEESCSSAADKAVCHNIENSHGQEDPKSTPSHGVTQVVGAIGPGHAAQGDNNECENPLSECANSISGSKGNKNNNGVNSVIVRERTHKTGREIESIQEEHPSSSLSSSYMLHDSNVAPKAVDISSLGGMTASRRAPGKCSESRWNTTLESYKQALGINHTPKLKIGECIQLKGKHFYPCMLPKGWPTSCPNGETRLGILLDDTAFYLASTNVSVSSATIVCSVPYMLLWGSPHPVDGRVLELSFPSSSPRHLVPGSDLFLLGRPPGPDKKPKWTQLLLTLSSVKNSSFLADIICKRHDETVSQQCGMSNALFKTLIEDLEGYC